jgi:hypothetical protein
MNSRLNAIRPTVLSQVATLTEEELELVHRVILTLEKERLWRELSNDFAADAAAGKYRNLDRIIKEARSSLAAE